MSFWVLHTYANTYYSLAQQVGAGYTNDTVNQTEINE